MSKKNWHVRLLAVLLAIFLAVPNVSFLTAYAVGETETPGKVAEVAPGEEPPAQTEPGETPVEIPAAMLLSEEAGEEDPTQEPVDLEESAIGELRQVYGLDEEELADEDALVLLIMGDGFTAGEQDAFYTAAEETAAYIMECSPFDEFTDVIKVYALGVVSNESGAQGEDAATEEEAAADVRDTYFGSSFWSYGMQRLLCLTEEGEAKGLALRDEYCASADFNLFLVNSATYGGSGGQDACVASLNEESLEIMIHEMGHSIANLADEYYAGGYEGEYANLTQESDPEKVVWSRFIGLNGVGVYDWGGIAGIGWYIPATDCKMQYLGQDYPFCEVCKEELRKAFCANSDVTKLFFQPYADEFLAGDGTDMSQYFILRRGENEITGDQLGDALTLTYYDAEGNAVDGIPSQAGDYTVVAEFAGDDTYDPCSVTGTYTIAPIAISLSVDSKVQDGEPAQLNLDVQYGEGVSEEDYYVDISYYGYQYYSYSVCASYAYYMYGEDAYMYYYVTDYDSESGEYIYLEYEEGWTTGGPTDPASYTVTVGVYDMEDNLVAEKTADYKISFATTRIVDNNDPDPYYGYYGANDYGNNRTVLIFGEGFTAEEQGKFDELASQLADTVLAEEPFKETQLYFNFTSVNTISRESGIGTGEEAQDTTFRLTLGEDGLLTDQACYSGTGVATNLGYYDVNPYYAACIVIVNDEDLADSAVYAEYWNDPTYHYYQTIFITPDEAGMEFAAGELLNHLNWNEPGYRAETEEEQAAQRQKLIDALHATYAPVITSRAYDEEIVANGQPVDLTSSFHVYYDGVELPDVELELTYFDAQGKELEGAPSEPGEYSVLAETVPYDPENPYEDYWQWYPLVGTEHEDWYEWMDGVYDGGLWIGLSRGYTTFTIEEPAFQPYDDVAEKTLENAWYYDAVYGVRDMGLMIGVGNNRFEPVRDMTRAEAAVIAVRLAGIDVSEYAGKETIFTDVPASHWGIDYIVAAYENGLVAGKGDNTFDPDSKVTREEFVTMLLAVLDDIDPDDYAGKETIFTDVPADSWAVKYIVAAYENGLTAGRGNNLFGYDCSILRAEVAVMLYVAESKF